MLIVSKISLIPSSMKKMTRAVELTVQCGSHMSLLKKSIVNLSLFSFERESVCVCVYCKIDFNVYNFHALRKKS